MATFDVSNQAAVKDSSTALVGIAQVRLALNTSMRAALTNVIAAATPLSAVGKSTMFLDATDSTEIVIPQVVYQANGATSSTAVAAGTYTGSVDGCFILRVLSATTGTLYAPDGTKTAVAALAVLAPGAVQGITITGAIVGGAAGDTFILPVVANTVQNSNQTGIVSPYSMFKGSTNSVGGLTDSSWEPKLDNIAKLESGFPSNVNDSIITKTSAGIKFTAQEYGNPVVSVLRYMANAAIGLGDLHSVAAEIVFRQRSGNLITYWCPSCNLQSVPTLSAKNDFSTVAWDLSVNKQVQGTAVTTYGAWLRNTPMFFELQYPH